MQFGAAHGSVLNPSAPETAVVWRSGPGDPAWNMAADEALLEAAQHLGSCVLRFYGWRETAATFGYFQKFSEVSGWTDLRPLIRRPTGGGLVPHDADWTYTLVFPPSHPWYLLRAEESYRHVHEWVAESLAGLRVNAALSPEAIRAGIGQCFIGAERFDVLAGGRKVAGAAQKRNKLGLLIQGSLQPLPGWSRERWEQAMLEIAAKKWGVQWKDFSPSEDFLSRARVLCEEKYATEAYNQRR